MKRILTIACHFPLADCLGNPRNWPHIGFVMLNLERKDVIHDPTRIKDKKPMGCMNRLFRVA
jgi:hypothetical protein